MGKTVLSCGGYPPCLGFFWAFSARFPLAGQGLGRERQPVRDALLSKGLWECELCHVCQTHNGDYG